MDNSQVRRCIDSGYEKFIEKSFIMAIENSLIGEPNAEARFRHAVEKASELRAKVLKEFF